MFFPICHFSGGCPVQEITINGGTNIVLTSVAAFTALDKACPITVNLTGVFNATSTGTPAFNVGDVSTWDNVEIFVQSGCDVWGKGGAGGNSSLGAGGNGGIAFQVNSANSSANLSVTIDSGGEVGGGGGGGKGGQRIAYSNHVGGDDGHGGSTCTNTSNIQCGGGGGGGGQTGITVGGGSRTTSTATGECSSITHGTVGASGLLSGRGLGGARGRSQKKPDNGSTCGACENRYGTAGSNGGAWATAGGGGAVGGASVANQGSASYTNNGTVH